MDCQKDTSHIIKNENKNLLLNLQRTYKYYCLNCKRNTKNPDQEMIKTKNRRLALSSKCAVCGSRKSRFIEEQEVEGLLSNLGIKAPLSKIPLLGDLLF